MLQQPHARVRGRLAGAEHGIGGARSRGCRQLVDGDEPRARRHLERRAWVAGIDAFQVASIDDLATHDHLVKISAAQVPDLLTVAPGAQVLVAGEHADRPVPVSRAAASAKYPRTSSPVARS